MKLKINQIFDFEKWSLQSLKNISWKYDFVTASKEWKTHNEFTHDWEFLIFAMWASWSLWRTHYVKWKFISSDLCFIISPKLIYKNKINLKFYHTYFNLIKADIVKNIATWTSKIAINRKNFWNYELFVPQIDFQNNFIDKFIKIKNNNDKLLNVTNQNQNYIKLIKQSILQEAIEWKLTKSWREENKDIESVSVLLEKIKVEKKELIKQKKLKKQKELEPIWKGDVPFYIPKSWEWVRLWDVFNIIEYGTSEKCDLNSEGIPVLRMWNIQNMWIDYNNLKYLYENSKDFPRLLLKNKDLLFNRTNSFELVWKTGIYLGDDDKYSFAWYLIRLRWNENYVDHFYINNYINSQFFRKSEIEPQIQQQCWQANFNWTKLKNTSLPFPPLSEQKQIVKKVDELMLLCDELEKQTLETKENSENLMKAVLGEVFSK